MEKEIKKNISIRSSILVIITNLSVDERYYFFNYTITVKGKKTKKGYCNSDYSNQTREQFIKVLKNGLAVQLALEDYF